MMASRRAMHTSRIMRATSLALCASVAISLSSCTQSASPDPAGSSTDPGATQTPAQKLADRSDLVTGYAMSTEPVGQASGRWGVTTGNSIAVDLVVYAVEASPTSTRLVYGLRATDGPNFSPSTYDRPELLPALVDTAGDAAYHVNRATLPNDRSMVGIRSIGSNTVGVDQGFAPLYAQYPPLAEGVTTVDIVMPNFDTVEDVSVTRR